MQLEILNIDDDHNVCIALRRMLQLQGYAVRSAHSGEDGLAICEMKMPTLVLLDIGLPGIDGLETLRRIQAMDDPCPVVMVTAYETASTVVKAMEFGASDYLTKPVTMEELCAVVAKLVGPSEIETDPGMPEVIGSSEAMQGVFRTAHRIAKTSATVLITGESGTGKEAVARGIHAISDHSDKPFVSVNCASIPANLLEDELFGHERGAFTDAKTEKQGLVEVACGGTLFLDEIGLMPIELQGKILTLLETRAFRRVGGSRELVADVRFIAATNIDLESAVSDHSFREDLFYRLNVIPVHLPPLREREDDILTLARHFLEDYSQRHSTARRQFTREAETLLMAYAWPGNVRELKNVIERAVLLTDGKQVAASDLSIDRRGQRDGSAVEQSAAIEVDKNGLIHISFPSWGLPLEDLERRVIEEALRHTHGNISRAARVLHISRHTLRYRMQKHGIAGEIDEPEAEAVS